MSNVVEVYVVGKDGLSRPVQAASHSLKGLQQAAGATSSALGGLGSMLGSVASQAAGFMTGMLGLQALGGITGAIQSAVGGMFNFNAEVESMRQSFKVLMSDAAAESSKAAMSQEELAAATAGAASSMQDAQQRMADAAEDHRYALEKLAKEFGNLEKEGTRSLARLAKDLGDSLAELSGSHGRTMDGLRRQLDEYSAAFTRQSAERRRRFDEEMADRQRRYREEIATIRQRFAEEARTAPDRFLREREAAERNAEFIQQAIAEEQAKGARADQAFLASLRSRLAQEQSLQNQTFAQFQAREKAKQVEEENAAKEALTAAEAAAKARYEAEEAAARESHDRQVAELQRRMAEEEAEYAAAVAKRKAKYDEDLAAYKESEAEKLAALKERQAEESRQYARTVRDAQEAIAKAGQGYAAAMQRVQRTQGGGVNQLKQMYADLASFVGRTLGSAEERAAAMLEFIEKKAAGTPFNIPELTEATNLLMAFRLNAVDYFDTVGNVAAGMRKPVEQVISAFGRLSAGQLGEAVEAFRYLGINLRDIEGLKWDAQGSLVTPTEEALARVKEALDVRFKGMMAEQMTTFRGIVSNLGDIWIKFEKVMGKPVFARAKESLADLLGYLDANEPQVMAWGEAIGDVLAGGLEEIGPKAKEAMVGFFEWIGSGQAVEDVRGLTNNAKDVVRFLGNMVRLGTDTVGWLRDTARWVDENRLLLGGILTAVGLIAAFLGGPLVWAFAAVAIGWGLMKEPIMRGIDDLGKAWQGFADEAGRRWGEFTKNAGKNWEAYTQFAKDSINAVIAMLNNLLQAWNDLSFTLPSVKKPDWMGGGEWGGWKIETPDIPLIPTLDTGAIVTGPTIAALAMNGRPELVAPLDRGGIIDYDRLAMALAKQPVYVKMNGRIVAEIMRQEHIEHGDRNGGRIWGR